MFRLALALALMLLATPARADVGDLRGGATLSYDLRYSRAAEDEAIGDLDEIMDVCLTTRAFAGAKLAGYAVGLDLHAGGGFAGGLSHEFDLYPIGYGVALGGVGLFGVVGGVGVSGVTDRVPFAWQFPVEAFAELALGSRFRLSGAASYRWIAGAAERQTAGGLTADETALTVALRFNRDHDKYRFRSGNGYYVGVTVVDRMDSRYTGVTFGYALHFLANAR